MSLTYKSPFQKWTEVVLIWLEKEVEKKRKWRHGVLKALRRSLRGSYGATGHHLEAIECAC